MQSVKRSLILLGITLLVFPRQFSAEGVDVHTPRTAIPVSFFGLHIHRAASGTPWPAVPFGAWRLWDASVTWRDLEPKKGEWHGDLLRHYLDLAEHEKVEVLVTLGVTPIWASSRPNEPAAHGPGAAAEPENLDDWRSYLHTVATMCKGRVRYYEIWNEPNLKQFYTGTEAQMADLARIAYATLKEVDSSNIVISPSVSIKGGGERWMSKYLESGGGRYTDVFGFHFYVSPQPPEAMIAQITSVRQLLSSYGLQNRPLWNTESGWELPRPFFSDDLAAAFVARSYVLNWAEGIERFFWYAWDNQDWVSLHMTAGDSKTPTAAAVAYAQVEKWLVGARMRGCRAGDTDTWVCRLERGGTKSNWIVWNPDHTMSFATPRAWHAQRVRDLNGSEQRIPSSGQLMVGPSPVLIEAGATRR